MWTDFGKKVSGKKKSRKILVDIKIARHALSTISCMRGRGISVQYLLVYAGSSGEINRWKLKKIVQCPSVDFPGILQQTAVFRGLFFQGLFFRDLFSGGFFLGIFYSGNFLPVDLFPGDFYPGFFFPGDLFSGDFFPRTYVNPLARANFKLSNCNFH